MMIGVCSTFVGGAVCLPSWVLYSTILTCSQSHLLESLTCFSGENFHLRGELRLTAGFRERLVTVVLAAVVPGHDFFHFANPIPRPLSRLLRRWRAGRHYHASPDKGEIAKTRSMLRTTAD